MTIGERIKKLRKALGLTQPEFGARMNATQNTIGRYEVNIVTPSSAAISLICKVFNVNENWLRTGEGEMFIEKDETLLAKFSAEYHLGTDDVSLITAYLQLSPKDRANIVRSAAIITRECQKMNKNTTKTIMELDADEVEAINRYRSEKAKTDAQSDS